MFACWVRCRTRCCVNRRARLVMVGFCFVLFCDRENIDVLINSTIVTSKLVME